MKAHKKILALSINSKTVLFCLLIVIGYLVWDKFNTQSQIAAKKKNELIAYSICVGRAEDNYQYNWAYACMKNAETLNKELKACKKLAAAHARYFASPYISYERLLSYGVAQCENTYGNESYKKADCLLPSHQADSFNTKLREDKQNCAYSSKIAH